jgi:hypothetical protein
MIILAFLVLIDRATLTSFWINSEYQNSKSGINQVSGIAVTGKPKVGFRFALRHRRGARKGGHV